MAGISVDVTVANRFMSRLIKSLQVLCSGCMTFDSEIEIVGHINVNIDSGSKMDYVLNEKVQKTKDDAITFVSNSFFAKKEKEKQLRDGSCSPVPELIIEAYETSSQNKSYSSYSYHSQILRRAHKRHLASREKDRRLLRRKYPKLSRSDHGSTSAQQSFSQPPTSYTQSTLSQPSHMPNNSLFQSECSSPSSSNACSTVCVKEESTELELPSGQNDSNQSGDHGYIEDRIQVKADPDSVHETENDAGLSTHFSDDHFRQQHSETPQQQMSSNDAGNTVLQNISLGDFSETYGNNKEFENSDTIPTSVDSLASSDDQGQISGDLECIEIDDDEEEQFQHCFGDNQSSHQEAGPVPQRHCFPAGQHRQSGNPDLAGPLPQLAGRTPGTDRHDQIPALPGPVAQLHQSTAGQVVRSWLRHRRAEVGGQRDRAAAGRPGLAEEASEAGRDDQPAGVHASSRQQAGPGGDRPGGRQQARLLRLRRRRSQGFYTRDRLLEMRNSPMSLIRPRNDPADLPLQVVFDTPSIKESNRTWDETFFRAMTTKRKAKKKNGSSNKSFEECCSNRSRCRESRETPGSRDHHRCRRRSCDRETYGSRDHHRSRMRSYDSDNVHDRHRDHRSDRDGDRDRHEVSKILGFSSFGGSKRVSE